MLKVFPIVEIEETSKRPKAPLRNSLSRAQLDAIWNPADWSEACDSFSSATGLTLSIYDTEGRLRIGPISNHPIGEFLAEVGIWRDDDSVGKRFEAEIVAKCLSTGQPVSVSFEQSLMVYGSPVYFGENIAGVAIMGWVFNSFPDPLNCERIARAVGTPGYQFWLKAREQSPVSGTRFDVFAGLLQTLVDSILKQKTYIENLRQSSQAKDEFLAAVSHELKTPLTAILLRSQMLKLEAETLRSGSPGLVDSLDSIIKNALAQNKIIDDLLESSRIITGKLRLQMESVAIHQVVSDAIDSVKSSVQAKGIQLVSELPDRGLKIWADPLRLQQVLWNLLSNALKFTPEGGTISIKCREFPQVIRIRVCDTGKGIDPEFLPRIFERFSQALPSKDVHNGGMGLGLSIAKHVIDFHGGSIEARSEGEDRGSTFTILLPKHQVPSPERGAV